jgi:hypothetical protein
MINRGSVRERESMNGTRNIERLEVRSLSALKCARLPLTLYGSARWSCRLAMGPSVCVMENM